MSLVHQGYDLSGHQKNSHKLKVSFHKKNLLTTLFGFTFSKLSAEISKSQ